MPEGDEDAIETDLRRMLDEAGISPVFILTVTEQARDERGMISPVSLAPLTLWIRELGADAPARAAIARHTLAGAVDALADNLRTVATAQRGQEEAHRELAGIAAQEYDNAQSAIDAALSDGSLLRGEVLSRWHDFVGTGDFFRSLDSTIGRLRDRVSSTLRGQPAARRVEDALENGIHAVVIDAAARASENTRARWRTTRAGRSLLNRLDEQQQAEETSKDAFSEEVAEQIRNWQSSVLDMIREEGAGKRQRARFLSLGVNATAVLLMVAAFSVTGGLTGIEVGIAGGSGVVGTKLLESVFGEDAVRRMATRARADLVQRMGVLLHNQGQEFTEILHRVQPVIPAVELQQAAQQVRSLAREIDTQRADRQ